MDQEKLAVVLSLKLEVQAPGRGPSSRPNSPRSSSMITLPTVSLTVLLLADSGRIAAADVCSNLSAHLSLSLAFSHSRTQR